VHLEISNDCNSCHQQEIYKTPTFVTPVILLILIILQNPNHIAAGFPTTCMRLSYYNWPWTPCNFDHDGQYFPIYTGEHAGEWNACADCHEVPNNFAVFTCISCHEHNQAGNG
jgi:hypothetical protein